MTERTDWEARYREADTPWDLGDAAPALRAALDADLIPAGRWLVPGCGRGQDAVALARTGRAVTALDVAPLAMADCVKLAAASGAALETVVGDALAFAPDPAARYDGVWEHTFLCALEPSDRPGWAKAVARWLRPGGMLAGLFYAHGREGGPPFHTDPDEVRRLLARDFEEVEFSVTPHSPERRIGTEWFGRFRRREG